MRRANKLLYAIFGWAAVSFAVAAQSTTRVSVSSAGTQADGASSQRPAISADGRLVAFTSDAANLVPGDSNSSPDIFVRNRETGQTTRVSVSSSGEPGNSRSEAPAISADGRFVTFDSHSFNLVPGDTNNVPDVFVHDRQTGLTTRVSVSSGGMQANDYSGGPSVSADGRFVAFSGLASNLVVGDTNGKDDVFVHDRQTGLTTRVSVSSSGAQGNMFSQSPSISSDGQLVAFLSAASNLVPGDTNNAWDIFVHDRQTAQTSRVSVTSTGTQGNSNSSNPSVSANGRFVSFHSAASNLVSGDANGVDDLFVHDRQTGLTTRVSVSTSGVQANGGSFFSSISVDGRWVAFHSSASNLVAGDTNARQDIFVHDRQLAQTARESVSTAGGQGNGWSVLPAITSDGRYVAFASDATNLTPGDTNNVYDIFVRDRGPPPPLCPGDANGDAVVDFLDLNIVLSDFGRIGYPGTIAGDVHADGAVDFLDLNMVLSFFGTVCGPA